MVATSKRRRDYVRVYSGQVSLRSCPGRDEGDPPSHHAEAGRRVWPRPASDCDCVNRHGRLGAVGRGFDSRQRRRVFLMMHSTSFGRVVRADSVRTVAAMPAASLAASLAGRGKPSLPNRGQPRLLCSSLRAARFAPPCCIGALTGWPPPPAPGHARPR